MKGFTLQVDGECISGAIGHGITGVLVTYKEGRFRVHFSSMDQSGMLSYTWYASDLKIGDSLKIYHEEITRCSKVREFIDFNKTEEQSDKESLAIYRKLKEELIEDGLI